MSILILLKRFLASYTPKSNSLLHSASAKSPGPVPTRQPFSIVKQIVTLVVVCFADVDRMRVAANKRTEPAMLVSDGRAEHVEATHERDEINCED
jgi:hypothetical protein